MNILRIFIPNEIIKYFKMLKSRLKFKNCRIDSAYVSTRAKLEDHIVIAEDSVIEPTVKIGRYTYKQANCNLNNCIMGSFCSLGSNVLIGPWQHPLNLMSTSPKIYRDILGGDFSDKPLQTTIGNDVWIGSNVIIIGLFFHDQWLKICTVKSLRDFQPLLHNLAHL